MTITTYITIGNSDDKLGQERWSSFVTQVDMALRVDAVSPVARRHGVWFSRPDAPWQNACWCVEVRPECVEELRGRLAQLAGLFGQDSIAWAPAPVVEFLGPQTAVAR